MYCDATSWVYAPKVESAHGSLERMVLEGEGDAVHGAPVWEPQVVMVLSV